MYKIIPLPVPKLIVFYNGQDNKPDEMILKLSDAFPKGSDPDVDVRVRMININHGKNSILLGACKLLWEYTWLIDRIWQNRKTTAIEEAVNSAIRDMPSEYSIKPFLIIHQAEVLGMLLTEYSEVETMNLFKREWKEEGHCCPTKMWLYSWFGTDFLPKGNSRQPPFARSSEPWHSITQYFTL